MNRVISNFLLKRIINRKQPICCVHNLIKFHNDENIFYKSTTTTNQMQQITIKRFKSNKKKSKKKVESSDDEDGTDNEEDDNENSKNTVALKSANPRVDSVLKKSLMLSRRSIEEAFYGSKIRVNGKKIFKKSEELRIDDEIDVFVKKSPDNPESFIVVHRIKILDMYNRNDVDYIKVLREKNLIIENYSS